MRFLSQLFRKKKNLRTEEEATQTVRLRTIPGEKRTKDFKRRFCTKLVGVTFENLNGSSRQRAIQLAKVGKRVQLAWNPSDPNDQNAILVFGKGSMTFLDENTCLGHLKEDLAADVVDWINNESIEGIYGEVAKILGGTKEFPTYGCLVELTLY